MKVFFHYFNFRFRFRNLCGNQSTMNLHIFVFILFLLFACCRLFMLNLSAICMHLCKSPLTKISTAIQATDRPTVRPSDQQRIFSSGHKEVRVKEHHHRLKLQQQQKASIYCLRVIKISTVSFLFFSFIF